MDQRLLAIHADPLQIKSVNEFVDSLIHELSAAEGTPAKGLMRELLAESLCRALEIAGSDSKQRFLDAVAANIHKFPLQEQQALSRAHNVEISSEYQNLQSFVVEEVTAEAPRSTAYTSLEAAPKAEAAAGTTSSPAASAPVLQELRRSLASLPPRPGPEAQSLAQRLLREAPGQVSAAGASARSAFLGELRLALFKFPDEKQKELLERFPELRQEISRLVISMTQEISRWLDEERALAAAHGRAGRRGSNASSGPLLAKLRALFQAVLSAPFSATFKHLGSAEKKIKEAFLLKIALCLRTCQDQGFFNTVEEAAEPGEDIATENEAAKSNAKEVSEQASQLRMQFFYVEGYGELMEDWLKNRIRQFNEEEFPQRVTAVLGINMQSVLTRLRRTFRPGRWLSLMDPQLEEDIFALFLDDNFPRHVLTMQSVGKLLQQVASFRGMEFQTYGGVIARAPPLMMSTQQQPLMQRDPTEAAVLEVLQRFPPFPPLTRVRPGSYLFGRVQVDFIMRGGSLLARTGSGTTLEERPAQDFFTYHGPLEFPSAADAAVQSPVDHLQADQPKIVDAGGATVQPGMAMFPPQLPAYQTPAGSSVYGMEAVAPLTPMTPVTPGFGLGTLPTPVPSMSARYEPYSVPTSSLQASAVQTGIPGKFGLDDDEI